MTLDLAPLLWAFGLSCTVTGLVWFVARRTGSMDVPDPSRRIHERPTPRLGGIGIFVGLLPALIGQPYTQAYALGAGLFFVVGLLDDLRVGRGLPAWVKLAMHLGAAAIPVFTFLGLRFEGRGHGPFPSLELGVLVSVMTVLWVFAVVNVVNFMDGIDGIVSVIGIVLFGAASAWAWPSTNAPLFAAAAASLAGFAVWNLPNAKIFMGDGGSHLLGFLIAATVCVSNDSVPEYVHPWHAVPWAVIGAGLLPAIFDVAEALIHKARVGVPLSQAHADHLYQRLVKAGSPAWLVALRYGGLSLAGVLLAGPVAERWGLVAAIVPGVALLALHWVQGVRATRNVPRLARP